jgi:hypothetical protein
MPPKVIIQAREIIADIRSGMSDGELMGKYRLNAKGLESAFSKLVNSGLLNVEEIYGHQREGEDTVIVDDLTLIPRHFLTVAVPLYEMGVPEAEGVLSEITERGMTIKGIPSRVGEIKTFVIPCRKFIKADSITFEAKCLWSNRQPPPDKWTSGFQITRIARDSLGGLRELVQLLTLG